MPRMRILAIETSCDETAVAILECAGTLENASYTILGNALFSQADLHAPYGGVYPSLAKREHQSNLVPLAVDALTQAGLLEQKASNIQNNTGLAKIRDEQFKKDVETFLATHAKPEVDVIAVTHGPGLEPALWTGINFAEALGTAWDIPVLGIDHMEGHIVSGLLKQESEKQLSTFNFQFPLLALLISGGHTELVLMKSWFDYEHVGRTKDDAVGEAFDKVARLLDLPYPGGPRVAESAERSRERGESPHTFPRPMMNDDTCDFSFSGLKTAVLYKLRGMEQISEHDKEEIAHAFEDAARDVLVEKTWRALQATHPKTLVIGGGVSANTQIRKGLQEMIAKESPETQLCLPVQFLTGDNAIMIGAAAYLRVLSGKKSDDASSDPKGSHELSALGNLCLSD